MNTVGWAFMYEVLWTCMTAPLEALLVDKAKYSENVGHHLVREIRMSEQASHDGESGEKKRSNEEKRQRRHASADPTGVRRSRG